MNLLHDIYYSKEYISLYIKENEEIFEFKYESGSNIFYTISIKRPIFKIGDTLLDEIYYDLETAYGYGGFYTNSNDESFIREAILKYEAKCHSNNIIAEFIRFHPFNNFPIEYSKFLDFNIEDRDVVVKDISIDILSSYKSKIRNSIKRATEKVTVQESTNINIFMELYNKTMEKNSADQFYLFDKSYYQNLLDNPLVKLYEVVYDETIIAMGFFMYGKDIAHYHLSANSELSYSLNSNYALLHHAFNEAYQQKRNYFLLGGGTTSHDDDPLFKFKKKFSQETKPFYISGKIYNQEVYNKYIELWDEKSSIDIKYFLKYRLETR